MGRKYGPELGAAIFLRRLVVRARMRRGIRRETDALAPEQGWYLRSRGNPPGR